MPRDWKKLHSTKFDTLTMSPKTFAEELMRKFRVISEQNVSLRVSVKLVKLEDEEEVKT